MWMHTVQPVQLWVRLTHTKSTRNSRFSCSPSPTLPPIPTANILSFRQKRQKSGHCADLIAVVQSVSGHSRFESAARTRRGRQPSSTHLGSHWLAVSLLIDLFLLVAQATSLPHRRCCSAVDVLSHWLPFTCMSRDLSVPVNILWLNAVGVQPLQTRAECGA